jgi:hypothetical protein
MPKYDFLHSNGHSSVDVGFRNGPRGTHSSRTIMLAELALIADRGLAGDVNKFVLDDNILGKSSSSGRSLTLQRLKELYSFERSTPIFRVFAGLCGRGPRVP